MAGEKEENLFKSLIFNFPNKGVVTWIGVRPKRNAPMVPLEKVNVLKSRLEGDHYSGNMSGKRHVTLIQEEHIIAVANLLNQQFIDPSLLRRNIVVKGINLLALKDQAFQIGKAVLTMSGLCHPCSRMEKNLGFGGYNAMRGHGGITCVVVKEGEIKLGDPVYPIL